MVGGWKHHELFFSEVSSNLQSSLMLLSVLGVSLPTMYCVLVPGGEAIEPISRVCATLLFLMYIQYLIFQLWTHADFIAEEEKAVQQPIPGRCGVQRVTSQDSIEKKASEKSDKSED